MQRPELKEKGMLSHASPKDPVPVNHPLRPFRAMMSEALEQTGRELEMSYLQTGLPSIVPRRRIRALLVQVLNAKRREWVRVVQLAYELLFRWFELLSVDELFWECPTFGENPD